MSKWICELTFCYLNSIGSLKTEPSTQESTMHQPKELQQTWNLFNLKLSTSSSGKLWSSILVTTSKLVNQLMWRNSVHSLTTCKLSSLRLLKETSALRLIFSLKDKREKTFITLSQFSLLTHSFNIIWWDIQERRKFPHRSVSTLSTKKDSDAFTPTQSQSLLPLASELMSWPMLWTHFS